MNEKKIGEIEKRNNYSEKKGVNETRIKGR